MLAALFTLGLPEGLPTLEAGWWPALTRALALLSLGAALVLALWPGLRRRYRRLALQGLRLALLLLVLLVAGATADGAGLWAPGTPPLYRAASLLVFVSLIALVVIIPMLFAQPSENSIPPTMGVAGPATRAEASSSWPETAVVAREGTARLRLAAPARAATPLDTMRSRPVNVSTWAARAVAPSQATTRAEGPPPPPPGPTPTSVDNLTESRRPAPNPGPAAAPTIPPATESARTLDEEGGTRLVPFPAEPPPAAGAPRSHQVLLQDLPTAPGGPPRYLPPHVRPVDPEETRIIRAPVAPRPVEPLMPTHPMRPGEQARLVSATAPKTEPTTLPRPMAPTSKRR